MTVLRGRGKTGGTNEMAIGTDNKARVRSISEDRQQEASLNGELFKITTPIIRLTGNATTSAVFYLANDTTSSLIIPELEITVGTTTGGDTTRLIQGIGRANVTGGTLVTDKAAASIIPLNTGVAQLPTGLTAYYGGEGKTVTYGLDIPSYGTYPQPTFIPQPFFLTVPKGGNFSIEFITPASNTGIDVSVGVRAYFASEE